MTPNARQRRLAPWRPWRCAALLALALGSPRPAAAQVVTPKAPIRVESERIEPVTFSRLVIGLPGRQPGAVDAGARLRFLDTLRGLGYPAVGGESAVFGQDASAKATRVVGGTLIEFDCHFPPAPGPRGERVGCAVGIRWEVLDRATGTIIYRVITRARAAGQSADQLAPWLVDAAFGALLARASFVAAVSREVAAPRAAVYPPASFSRCRAKERPMPGAADAATEAVALLTVGDRMGSGTFISPDGLVLTAAHVVAGTTRVTAQQRGGPPLDAVVVRRDEGSDVALVKVAQGTGYACLPLRPGRPVLGEDLFAIGSPLSKALSFSLTRGVVSGVREDEGVGLVQTDASVNPGNSGGPLLDAQGRLVAVVSFKAAGPDVEGIAFGVVADDSLRRLSLSPGEATDPSLGQPDPAGPAPAGAKVVADTDDPRLEPWIDAPGTPRSLEPPEPAPGRTLRAEEVDAPPGPRTTIATTTGAVGWSMFALGAVGVASAAVWYGVRHDVMDARAFEDLRGLSGVAWILGGVGLGTVLVAELLPRGAPEAPATPAAPARGARPAAGGVSLGLGAGKVCVQGAF